MHYKKQFLLFLFLDKKKYNFKKFFQTFFKFNPILC